MKNLIKVERARHDLTQAQLADELGVSRQTIHAIEKNKFNPSVTLAIKMARFFKVTVEYLFDIEEED
ncbi:helix-turn-helix transcriptional regulator [Lutibacter sp. A80]|uniref:helix-turn-helix transcriptional regulator n=1 Tax=unclassified Lutibacter TaxID=2626258 RepID=UPI001F06023F|nr:MULTISPECIES: helix-turn-helix transcriptional regulator [unclassified Lutibacter]UMB52995.1 helix-turn-helix transcriptional regulator [Lutibacter sp. A64]UMB59509.1 helix-turn-helix transcriptional regulator [Lutibacter sp. A80]